MANAQNTLPTVTVTAQAVASGLRAGGRAFVDMLGLVLINSAVKPADAVESVIAEVKSALVAQHNEAAGAAVPPQAAAPQGDKARGFLVQGYKTALNYSAMLRKAEKAANGLDLIRAGFEGGMTVAQFADSLPSSNKKAAKEETAPAPAGEGGGETINAAPAPADMIELESVEMSGDVIVQATINGVSFIRESVLIATVSELNNVREQLAAAADAVIARNFTIGDLTAEVAALRLELATMQAAKVSSKAKASSKAKQAA